MIEETAVAAMQGTIDEMEHELVVAHSENGVVFVEDGRAVAGIEEVSDGLYRSWSLYEDDPSTRWPVETGELPECLSSVLVLQLRHQIEELYRSFA